MSSYDAFLKILSRLVEAKATRIEIQDHVIFIEATKKNRWNISTKVFEGEDFIPLNIRECVSSEGTLKWQGGGVYLKLDTSQYSVFLIQEIESLDKYIPFKAIIENFIQLAREWKAILDDFSQRDHLPVKS